MGQIKFTRKYKCYNDCSQAGCPEHEATLEFNTATDLVEFNAGQGDSRRIHLEPPEMNVFVDMLKELDELRADAPVKFKKEI